METTFRLDTALNLDCDQIVDITLVSETKQMSISYNSIAQYCIIRMNTQCLLTHNSDQVKILVVLHLQFLSCNPL